MHGLFRMFNENGIGKKMFAFKSNNFHIQNKIN